MSLQVLLSTMKQTDASIIEKMNLHSDAIIINQTDNNSYKRIVTDDGVVDFWNFAERGVGLSRNNALMRATAEICLFADDDVCYLDDYVATIENEFLRHPEADVIAFNVPSTNTDPRMKDYKAKKWRRLNLLNCFRHGTFRIAIRRNEVVKKNIFFTLLFGGGAKYSAGEDSLFLADCIRKRLKVYESPEVIGQVSHAESTWFNGYTDKYFMDKGAFYACFSKVCPFVWCLQFAIRRKNLFCHEVPVLRACKLMHDGIREFRSRGRE